MNIKIGKETIFDELVKLLGKIFALPEVRKVKIREYEIFSEKEVEKIKNALQESYHDILSDVDVGVQATLHPADFGMDFPYHNNPGRIGLDRETYLGLAYSGAGELNPSDLHILYGSMRRFTSSYAKIRQLRLTNS